MKPVHRLATDAQRRKISESNKLWWATATPEQRDRRKRKSVKKDVKS